MRKVYACALVSLFFFTSATLFAQPPAVGYAALVGGLSAPVEVVNAGDGTGRLFIVEQSGAIKVYDPANGGLQATPFLNVGSLIRYDVGGERGLLSLAFHPAYETNGFFYIYYNNTSGAITVARYKVSASPNVADAASGVAFLTISKPFDNHNGGHMQFAADGTLYFATGDGGSGNDPFNNAQNTSSRLGKMLRLNVYTNPGPPYFDAPANNPFVGNAAYDPLIWAYGLRNPYRWSFDRLTGDVWIGDVGQGAKEEINYRPAASTGGENYGWRCYEGSIPNPNIPACNPALTNHVPPVFDYDNPSSGLASVAGGYVYRGTQFPSLYGYYFAADVYSGNLYMLAPNGTGGFLSYVKTGLQNFVVGFGEGEDGKLYAVSQATGTLYQVVDPTALPVSLRSFAARRAASGNELQWTTAWEQNLVRFEVEYSTDGNRFANVGAVPAGGGSYSFVHHASRTGTAYYRLRTVELDGRFSHSATVRLDGTAAPVQIFPTHIQNARLYVQSSAAVQTLQLLNATGAVVFEKNFGGASGQLAVPLPVLPKGVYIARVVGPFISTQKLLIE